MHGAIVQVLMLGAQPIVCLGASAIVYGFMAMSLIWAPENEMQCVFVFLFRPFFFDVRIKVMVGCLLGLQILILILTHAALSSEFLHSVGAGIGFGVGIWMLKAGWVDCENWDFFSVRAGRHSMTEDERARHDAETPEGKKLHAEQVRLHRQRALDEIRRTIGNGLPLFALKIHQRMAKEQRDWKLAEPDLFGLIRSLQEKKLWKESMPVMQEYILQYPEKAALVRLKLAQLFLTEDKRPRKATKLLSEIIPSTLDARHREFLDKLRAKAEQMYGEDTYELVEE
jgi:hypothetical protein